MRVLLFPGQGSQFVGMGRDLHQAHPAARDLLDRADRILGTPLTRLMFEGPEEELRATRNAQPAILAHSLAVWAILEPRWGAETFVAAGHSLGEYSAHVVAGTLSFEDALRLVRRRGELMQAAGEASAGAMAAILGSDRETVEAVCAETQGLVVPANLNAPNQVVISGERAAVRAALETLGARGARRVVELKVSGAFHSPLMAPASEGLAQALADVALTDARCAVYANVTAEPVTEESRIRGLLVEQLLKPVLWEPTLRKLIALDEPAFFEIGPGQVLKGLLRATDRSLSCRSLGTAEEVLAFLDEV
ncbi:MAG: ACP S-malonyltransferase [Candidatus Eisenbacteria sp.]|nr:ACP S-malonyltransferase [Candidatus Eisenbacteria bacterium]